MTEIKRYRRDRIQDGTKLLNKKRPNIGFYSKSRQSYTKNGETHTRFSWAPVTVKEIWVTEDEKKCQIHFLVLSGDKAIRLDQHISRPKYESFRTFKFEADCIDLIDDVLKRNRRGLCMHKHTKEKFVRLKISKSLYDELEEGRKICGQNMNEYCIGLLSGKRPMAALTDDEIELLKYIKKVRSDVQLMFNAMVTEFARLSDAELMKVVIQGKSFEWWREYLITALETLDELARRIAHVSD